VFSIEPVGIFDCLEDEAREKITKMKQMTIVSK